MAVACVSTLPLDRRSIEITYRTSPFETCCPSETRFSTIVPVSRG